MTWRCPDPVEEALWIAARDLLPARALAPATLRDTIVDRSRRYTSDRALLHLPPADPDADLAARALFFTIADAPKPLVPLAELARANLLPRSSPLHILDLGAGCGGWGQVLGAQDPGTMPEVLRSAMEGRRLVFRAVDRDRRALQIHEAAARALPWRDRIQLTLVHGDAMRADPGPPADLVLASGLLNELDDEAAFELVRRMLGRIAPGGAVIVIEPALRDTARALHRIRDRVLDGRLAHVFAPCVRQGPCPALLHPDDWCHEDRPAELPPRAAELGAATGLRRHGMKFAYLVLRDDPEPLVEPPPAPRRALRVVSRLESTKGKLELIGCGEQGWVDVRLLKRRRSPANRPFEQARRGDVLRVGAADDLGTDDPVERLTIDAGDPDD